MRSDRKASAGRGDLCEVILVMDAVYITAVYHFTPLDEVTRSEIRSAVKSIEGLRGLLVVGSEGFNGTLSGSHEVIQSFKRLMSGFARGEVEFKDSLSEQHPFKRLVIDDRPEIVTSRWNVSPLTSGDDLANTYLSAEEWHNRLMADPDACVVDTRNAYEAEIGMFRNAVDPKIAKFSEFREYVERSDLARDRPVYLYCTGGIRCEKAVIEMKQLGFSDVFQLHGGILKYLERYPDGLFDGECFVFDRRVAVTNELKPSETYSQCPHCGNPGKERIECGRCSKKAIVCHHCLERPHRRSCSKDCAHHYEKKLLAAAS